MEQLLTLPKKDFKPLQDPIMSWLSDLQLLDLFNSKEGQSSPPSGFKNYIELN